MLFKKKIVVGTVKNLSGWAKIGTIDLVKPWRKPAHWCSLWL